MTKKKKGESEKIGGGGSTDVFTGVCGSQEDSRRHPEPTLTIVWLKSKVLPESFDRSHRQGKIPLHLRQTGKSRTQGSQKEMIVSLLLGN